MIGLLVLEAGGKLTAAGCLGKAAAGCAQSMRWDQKWGDVSGRPRDLYGAPTSRRLWMGVGWRRVVAAPYFTLFPTFSSRLTG